MRGWLAALAVVAVCGCGGDRSPAQLPRTAPSVGPSARHRPPSLGAIAARGLPIRGLRCTRRGGARFGVHLELFAARRVVLIPPGIGIAPPRTQAGAYVRAGRCSYPLRTREPTGVIEIQATGRAKTLGDLFAIWGQPLGVAEMAGFGGQVTASVNGRRWSGAPGAIPLRRHAQIVLEVGGYVRPHATYRFPPGL
jgi:hypothetical protein